MRLLLPLLAFALSACSDAYQPETGNAASPDGTRASDGDARAQFLAATGGDDWADWPVDLTEDSTDHGRACLRVIAPMRERAVALLAQDDALRLEEGQYRRLIGKARPPGGGAPYLLRGFASTNSIARVQRSGEAIVVHSDSGGGPADLSKHPCVAILDRMPSQVFTVVSYDL